jgi:hypothetical protein
MPKISVYGEVDQFLSFAYFLVGWYASAACLTLSDVILAQQVCPNYLRYLKNFLSFDDGKIFAVVAERQNGTIANRKILFFKVLNHEMPIVHPN